jgi:hypothetical protein
MKFKISHNDYNNLCYEIEKSLSAALKDLSQHEPQLVANMVWHVPRQLNGYILKKGLNIESGGVFVHQKPQVKCADFPDKKHESVEIGDVLFLRTEKQNGKVSSRSAFLFQAKKFNKLPAKPNNYNQHHLYANWPLFEYIRSSSVLNGKNRHITGPDLYNATKYLLIDEDPKCCLESAFCHIYNFKRHWHHHCVLTAQPSYPEISQYRCFVEELTDFILGDAGKPFQSPHPAYKRNWDRVIDDLQNLTRNAASVYMTRASSGISSSRGQYLCFLSGDCMVEDSILLKMNLPRQAEINSDGPPEVPPADYKDDSNDGGVSIIEFVVSTKEERRSQ